MITVTVSLNSLGIPPSVLPARLSGAAAGIVEDDKRGNAQVVMNHDYDWTPGRVTVPVTGPVFSPGRRPRLPRAGAGGIDAGPRRRAWQRPAADVASGRCSWVHRPGLPAPAGQRPAAQPECRACANTSI